MPHRTYKDLYPKEVLDYIEEQIHIIGINAVIARDIKDRFKLKEREETLRVLVSKTRSANILQVNKPVKRLFFDIETSPNVGIFWRSGYNQTITPHQILEERKIICVSYKWQGENKVHTIKWDREQCDRKLIIEFSKIMLKADEIVGNNSDRFDEKWLRTRAIYHRLPMLPKYKSLDTLKKAKRHFNFQSNSLKYIADFLGVAQKGDAGGLDTWKAIMFDNCKQAMKDMVRYCEQDVIVLEDIYHALNPYIYNNTNYSVLKGGRNFNCPECASPHIKLVKTQTTTAGTIQRIMECNSCNKNYKLNNNKYINFLGANLNPE